MNPRLQTSDLNSLSGAAASTPKTHNPSAPRNDHERQHEAGYIREDTDIEARHEVEAWHDFLPTKLVQCYINDRHARLFLELRLKYCTYEPHRRICNNKDCAGMVRKALTGKIIETFDQKRFLPTGFLTEYFDRDLVRHLVHRDKSLRQDGVWNGPPDQEKFVKDVYNFGVWLLATCIYEELDLICLIRLLKHGKQEANITFLHRLSARDRLSAAETLLSLVYQPR